MTDEQERYTARKVGEVSLEAMKAMSKALNDWAAHSKHSTPLLVYAMYVAVRAIAEASPPPSDDPETNDLIRDIIAVMKKHVALGAIDRDAPEPMPGAKVWLA